MNKIKIYLPTILTGIVIGIAALVLSAMGNPGNMGFCIACFLRDMAGSMGFHSAAVVQYMRPEIIGLVLGAFLISLIKKEFRSRGGSAPMLRFVLGIVVMVGALMFLGCPLRMVLRIGGGDLNAIVGLVGFFVGILAGIFFLNKGFSLQRAYPQNKLDGLATPIIMGVLFLLLVFVPSLLKFSESGPGASHAPIIVALIAGLVVGILAQRSRICMVGGLRDGVMFRDFKLLAGFAAIIVTVLIGNAILGKLHFGFAEQPVAHTDGVWNFLGMALVGWGSILLGGCPLRQLILAGEGNSDSGVTIAGYIVGAAICHNFGLASSANGPTLNGQIAVIIGVIAVAIISICNRQK